MSSTVTFWWILVLFGVFVTFGGFILNSGLGVFLLILLLIYLLASVRVVYEYQRGIVFSLGRYEGLLQPGLNIVVPVLQTARIVDLRLEVDDVAEQSPITKDNVSITVDAVIYYRIMKETPQDSVIKVEDYRYAINQLAQTTMRNVVGETTLDELLSKREAISDKIRSIVDKVSTPWGIKVVSVELKRVELPESMKRIMANQAEAERVRRAVIIRSEGEALASKVVAQAAEVITSTEGGLNMRTLQSLAQIASDQSNQVHFYVPLDVIQPYEGYRKKEGGSK
jgi:regulator of protease activity HflC (stomatin/prohibitin superfamily)